MPSLCQQGVILIRHARLPAWQRERWQQLHQHRAVDRHADLMVQDEGKAGLGSPPRPADNNSASRQSRRFDSVIQCFFFSFLQLYCRMLLWEYRWWTDIRVQLGPHQLGEQSRGYGSNDQLVALLDWVLHCSLCAGKNTGGRRNHVEDRTRRPRQGPSSQN